MGISLAEEALCYSLHLSVLLLRSQAIRLVVEGLDKGMELKQFCHVQLLHILSKDRVHRSLRKGVRLLSYDLELSCDIELFDKLLKTFEQPQNIPLQLLIA